LAGRFKGKNAGERGQQSPRRRRKCGRKCVDVGMEMSLCAIGGRIGIRCPMGAGAEETASRGS